MKRSWKIGAIIVALALQACTTSGTLQHHGRLGASTPIAIPGQSINYDPTVSPGLIADTGTTVYDSGGVISWLKYAAGNTSWRPVPISQLVTTDPSTGGGLKAPIGFIVYKFDGTQVWSKTGSGDTQWTAGLGGGGGGTVHVTAPIGGDGSSGTPVNLATDATLSVNGSNQLRVDPAAARAPTWPEYMKNIFIQKTGVLPIKAQCYATSFCDTSKTTTNAISQGYVLGGTGAADYTNIVGCVIKSTGPTGGSGFSDREPSGNGTAWTTIGNLRTTHWMVGERVANGKAPVAASKVSFGVYAGGPFVGIGYAKADTTWQFIQGNTITDVADTGVTITNDSTGATGWHSMIVGNFDLINAGYNANVEADPTVPITTAEAASSLPNSAATEYWASEGTGSPGAGDIYFASNGIFCTEVP